MSQSSLTSLSSFNSSLRKSIREFDVPRTQSTPRQTITGFKPSISARSNSMGRESIVASKLKPTTSLAPTAMKSAKKGDAKLFIDKNKINDIIDKIFDFLNTNSYDKSLSKKSLLTGNKNSFLTMLNFLFKQIDPNFGVNFLFASEEDIINLLKIIGYPYFFSKAFFAAIGAPNNWNQCLHILNWMIELIKYNQIANESVSKESANTKFDYDILNENLRKSFFNNEGDNLLSSLADDFESRAQKLKDTYKEYELKIENIKLANQNTLNIYPDLSELDLKISQVGDMKYHEEQVLARLKNENDSIIALSKDQKKRLEVLDREMHLLNEEKTRLLNLITGQGVGPEESEQLRNEIKKNVDKVNQLNSLKLERSNLKFETEKKLDEIVNELETKAQEYNSIICNLRDLLAKFPNYVIKFNHTPLQGITKEDTFKTNIYQIIYDVDENQEITLKRIIDNIQNDISELENELSQTKIELHIDEDNLRSISAEFDKESYKQRRLEEINNEKILSIERENEKFLEKTKRFEEDVKAILEERNKLEKQKIVEMDILDLKMGELEKVAEENQTLEKDLKALLESDIHFACSHKKQMQQGVAQISNKLDAILEYIKAYLDSDEDDIKNE